MPTEAHTATKRIRGTKPATKRLPSATVQDLASEGEIQRSIVQHWKLLGMPGSILAHIPNGEKRDPVTAAKLKALGVLPGIPDLLCVSPRSGVFFVELKRHGGRTSPEQQSVHERLRTAGVEVFTVVGVDDAVALLEQRGVIRKSREFQKAVDNSW
jgi:hypothetical protein